MARRARRGGRAVAMEEFSRLRLGIRLAMAMSCVLVFLLVGGPLLYLVATALAALWQIDMEAPVRFQPHGWAWFFGLLAAFLCIIVPIVGAVWTYLAIAWLVRVRGWSVHAASDAIKSYKYPASWV